MKSIPVLALILIALGAGMTCLSCVHFGSEDTFSGRTVGKQWDSAVAIQVSCLAGPTFGGSGVIIDDTHVLTAYHVVQENWDANRRKRDADGNHIKEDWQHCNDQTIIIHEVDGSEHEVYVEKQSSSWDIASLRLKTPGVKFSDKPPVFGPSPLLGEAVCVVSLLPDRWRRCGSAQPPNTGMIRADVTVEHGNSGSPVYDSAGRLVGIVTIQFKGEADQIMGMEAVALDSVPWIK